MSFFGLNLHAMLVGISARAKELGTPEAAEKIDAVIKFFNDSGFPVQACVRDNGLRWEELTSSEKQQFNQVERPDIQQCDGFVRVNYLGRVVFAKPLLLQGKNCLFQIHDSTQRINLPTSFVLSQDQEILKGIIAELSHAGDQKSEVENEKIPTVLHEETT